MRTTTEVNDTTGQPRKKLDPLIAGCGLALGFAGALFFAIGFDGAGLPLVMAAGVLGAVA